MSWQAAVLAILAASLAGGVLWYERSRPPAQIVALVAALAALGAAGRVALSPVPNVVPTTDITLIAGFALGGPPGFAVGAFAALASNFWLGQGPWTPWQMAAWGLTGVLGAALARLTGRRLGRFGLAAACGFAGLAYGALLDLSVMVTYGGEQSLDRYLALSARGIPFNVAHAAGNVVFALVAGPALVRMLERYRRRFEFVWPGRRRATGAVAGVACLLAALAMLSPAAGPHSADAASKGPAAAASWLRSQQDSSGGFAATPDGDPNPAMTGWVALALEARGAHPSRVSSGGASALAYLRETVDEVSTTGDIERTILVLAAAGADPRGFGGRDLVERLARRRGANGSWGGQVNLTSFGILALDAAGARSGNPRSAAWLRGAANGDGGWGFVSGAPSDADSTGAAMQALAAAGGSSAALRGGISYLRGAQRANGGFSLSGGAVNSQSTAWAVQGLLAAGVPPGAVRSSGRSPLDYLSSVQAADGHYRYSATSDQTPVWVTAQAVLAAARAPFPIPRVSATTATPAAGGGSGGGGGAASSGGTGAAVRGSGGSGASPGTSGGATGAAAAEGAVAGAAAASQEGSPAVPVAQTGAASGSSGKGASGGVIAGIALCVIVALGGAFLVARQQRRPGGG